jgi:hypothetical protein
MASVLAAAAGWWQLEQLLGSLSQQAAAGVRPELLPLMAVPGMTGAHARALHAAGMTRPEVQLVCHGEGILGSFWAASRQLLGIFWADSRQILGRF